MPEAQEIFEILINLWADQNNQVIKSIEIKKGEEQC